MKKLFADYLEIYEAFPVNSYLTKEKRKQRYETLCLYEKESYNEAVDIRELENFLQAYQEKIQLTQPFMKQIIPILKQDIEEGGIFALKFLMSSKEGWWETVYHHFYNLCYAEFGEYVDLIDLLLEREPTYLPALQEKYKIFERSTDFDLHELPWAVLLDYHAVDNAIQDMETFQALGLKLGVDADSLQKNVAEARFYYLAWKDYLEHTNKYADFPTYLEKNQDVNPS